MKKTLCAMVIGVATLTAGAQMSTNMPADGVKTGRGLFLKNCAHCHGADGHGDDGPDLHNLDWTNEQISKRILNGKKGQMPAFKLSADEVKAIVTYVRTLK
ncbi:MAG TPA: cytochrome c [Desulfuromonadaceae bacterium]|nr:cytochrome c [Desulfuromonadaceae bacterium]